MLPGRKEEIRQCWEGPDYVSWKIKRNNILCFGTSVSGQFSGQFSGQSVSKNLLDDGIKTRIRTSCLAYIIHSRQNHQLWEHNIPSLGAKNSHLWNIFFTCSCLSRYVLSVIVSHILAKHPLPTVATSGHIAHHFKLIRLFLKKMLLEYKILCE